PGLVGKILPVALWLHGGGFREGFGSEPVFDGQAWGAKDVVLVSINYRLGVFGFLVHPALAEESPHKVSGNYGILDQIEALKWIKKNIEQFGGDPNNVTIFGQSAGGGSVRTLCESPLARGLFHKAVIMSAQGLSIPNPNGGGMMGGRYSGGSIEDAGANAKKIFDWAGLTDLQKMRQASTETIFALTNIYGMVNGNGQQAGGMGMPGMRMGLPFMPMIDGYVSVKSFDDATREGTLADVPYMIGFTLNDMGDMAPNIAEFCKVRQQKGGKAWAYEFARPLPDDGSHPEVTQRLRGAFHSSDLWFVFKSLKHCWRPWTKGDWDLSEKMLTAWTNFAKYSDPNGPQGGNWAPCTEKTPKFMVFKLNEQDAEASVFGDPEKAPQQGGFPGFGGAGAPGSGR
ncbi:MAG: carboxylesterase family protein, partial [Bacteroidaceae bacterium]|nr:carboxylesterase family protein [Bacteroidaceae bacterium]